MVVGCVETVHFEKVSPSSAAASTTEPASTSSVLSSSSSSSSSSPSSSSASTRQTAHCSRSGKQTITLDVPSVGAVRVHASLLLLLARVADGMSRYSFAALVLVWSGACFLWCRCVGVVWDANAYRCTGAACNVSAGSFVFRSRCGMGFEALTSRCVAWFQRKE
eukprot:162792-Rhodomonas_salina.2